MGLTFKENCPDLRNSGVESVINELKNYQCNIDLYDPWANSDEVKNIYNILPITTLNPNTYHGIIIAIAHKQFKAMGVNFISALGKEVCVLYDLKYIFPKKDSDLRL